MPEQNITPYPFLVREMLAFNDGASFSLIVQVISTTTDPIEVRGFTKEGPFTFSIIPTTANERESFTLAIPDIPIAVSIKTAAESNNEQSAYVVAHYAVNGNRMNILCQGTISTLFGVAYPHQMPLTNAQLFGVPEEIFFNVGGAGNDLDETLPPNQSWEILRVWIRLDTDATAANRIPILEFGGDSSNPMSAVDGTAVTANQVVEISFVPGGTTQVNVANSEHEVRLPTPLILKSGASLATNITNLQAGDEVTDAVAFIRRIYHGTTE